MLKFILISLLGISSAFAQMDFCTPELETYPVLAGGREKPLYVLATETAKYMTGSDKIDGMPATVVFCKLSLKAFGMPIKIPVNIKVDHVEARKLLGLKKDATSIPVEELEGKADVVSGTSCYLSGHHKCPRLDSAT
jgi:hypothetical protein